MGGGVNIIFKIKRHEKGYKVTIQFFLIREIQKYFYKMNKGKSSSTVQLISRWRETWKSFTVRLAFGDFFLLF